MASDQCGCVKLVVGSWSLSRFFIFSEFFSGLCLCSSSGSYSCSSSCSSSWLPCLNDAVTSTLPCCSRPRPCCRPEVLSQGEAGGQVQSQAVETRNVYSISRPNFSAGLLTSALFSSKTSLPTFPWPGSGLFLRLW